MNTTNKQATQLTGADEVAAMLVKEARSVLGAGWSHVSPTIQRALVMERILCSVVLARPGADEAEIHWGRELVRAADRILGMHQ